MCAYVRACVCVCASILIYSIDVVYSLKFEPIVIAYLFFCFGASLTDRVL